MYSKLKLLPVSILMLLSVASARELTLVQALDQARSHSNALRRAESNRSAAAAELRAAHADRFPTLSATGLASYVDYVPMLTIDNPLGPDITRPIGTHESYQMDLRASLPLYTGGRISSRIDNASALRDISDALAASEENRLLLQTRQEYFGLERAQELLAASRASRERAGLVQSDVQSLFAAGAADSVDLLEARLAVTQADFAVNQAETNRRASEIRLLTLLGLASGDSLRLTDTLPSPATLPAPETLADSKPELLASDAAIKQTQSRVRLTRADYAPTISVYGGYSYGKPNLDRFGNTWNDYFTVGANLSWNFNLGGKTPLLTRASRHYFEAASSDRQQLQENLTRDMKLAYEQVKLAFDRFQSSQMEQSISSDNYRLARARYRDGVLSSNRLLEIEAALTSADAALAAARADYYVALSAYYYASGSDLLRKGI